MGLRGIRDDLDQLLTEWRAHRGAEISLMNGLAATNERLAEIQRQLTALGDFTEDLERRVKALGAPSCPDHRFGDRGICFTCGAPRDAAS